MVVTALLLVLILWAGQRQLMYFPSGDVPTPASLRIDNVEEIAFATADGLRLSGWLFPVETAATISTLRAAGERRLTVVVFNGNAGNRAHRAPLAAALRQLGVQVLLFDYRGFGGNQGAPTEPGLALDARGAREFLIRERGIEPGSLIYFGESLGTGVAVNLAIEHRPAALILRSPFTSMADVGQHHYRWLPVRRLIRDRYDSLALIPQLRTPLLIIAGERDRVVPAEFSRRLYEAAPQPKVYVSLPGADHNDYALLAGDTMMSSIATFLGR